MIKMIDHERLYVKARQAGLEAGKNEQTSTMIVSGRYIVPDGPCGFAWVIVKPGTSSFARWLVRTNRGSKAYRGGVQIWVSDFNQSMERKSAYADAFAKVLQQAGIECYSDSRMD